MVGSASTMVPAAAFVLISAFAALGVISEEDGGLREALGFLACLTVPALLLPIRNRALYLLPFIPWLVLALLGTDAGTRSRWEDLWFLNLFGLALLQIVITWALRVLARRRLPD